MIENISHKNNYCVIMAGGVGSRFWPMSRTAHPKQFIDILGTGQTLLQQTYQRFLPICPKENIYIVTNVIYKDIVLDQLKGIQENQVICEPSRRNTAPCIAYASYKINAINPNANIIVAPSDHLILKEKEFHSILNLALKQVNKNDYLITLGIKPNRPDTGYGYIQFDDNNITGNKKIKKVKTFTEKPSLEIAQRFLESGDFYWNSGIFIWNVKSILNAFDKYLPEINDLFNISTINYNTPEEKNAIENIYKVCKNISIDYGIMEKANNVYVVLSDFGWSDLGTWGSIFTHLKKDKQNNAIIGKKVMMYDSENCIVNMSKDKLVVLQGLYDYIVVESDGILLICKKTDEQKIKQFVSDIRINKGEYYI